MSVLRTPIALSILASAALALAACNSPPPASASADTAAPGNAVTSATAPAPADAAAVDAVANAPEAQVVLKPTQGQGAAGTMTLRAEAGGVRIRGQLTGLTPGSEHGFHIHENGDCSAPDASSAGGHFNPDDQPHGSMDSGAHHAGDMPNQRADAQGVAAVDTLLGGASLDAGSARNVIGRALVVHQQPDDYKSQPAGNAGPRIACGVISAERTRL
ncbi:MAG: superoxide dismutase family protein [Rhodanobacter sp.]